MRKTLLFICETGVSAALFVSKMLESIQLRKLNINVDYAPVSRVQEKIELKNYDCILLSPQVHRYEEDLNILLTQTKEKCVIIAIQPEEFIMMNVEKILDRLLEEHIV